MLILECNIILVCEIPPAHTRYPLVSVPRCTSSYNIFSKHASCWDCIFCFFPFFPSLIFLVLEAKFGLEENEFLHNSCMLENNKLGLPDALSLMWMSSTIALTKTLHTSTYIQTLHTIYVTHSTDYTLRDINGVYHYYMSFHVFAVDCAKNFCGCSSSLAGCFSNQTPCMHHFHKKCHSCLDH